MGKIEEKIKLKVLIVPKFEDISQAGNKYGEATPFFEKYVSGGAELKIPGGSTLYYKGGVGFYVSGIGKTLSAINMTALLASPFLDLSDTLILSVGCCGSSFGETALLDVFLITAAVDGDLGHECDGMWFRDRSYDTSAVVMLDKDTAEYSFNLIKDIILEDSEDAREYTENCFPDYPEMLRHPKVLKGSTLSGDNYWKGQTGHENAKQKVSSYICPDPFVSTEMEDIAVAGAVRSFGLLKNLVILRTSVNFDVFAPGENAYSVFGKDEAGAGLETIAMKVFQTASENLYKAGKILIEDRLER